MHPGRRGRNRLHYLGSDFLGANVHHLGAKMVGHDLEDGIQVEQSEVLENLNHRLAAPRVLLHHLIELQIVNQTPLLNERQQWNRGNVRHTRLRLASTCSTT